MDVDPWRNPFVEETTAKPASTSTNAASIRKHSTPASAWAADDDAELEEVAVTAPGIHHSLGPASSFSGNINGSDHDAPSSNSWDPAAAEQDTVWTWQGQNAAAKPDADDGWGQSRLDSGWGVSVDEIAPTSPLDAVALSPRSPSYPVGISGGEDSSPWGSTHDDASSSITAIPSKTLDATVLHEPTLDAGSRPFEDAETRPPGSPDPDGFGSFEAAALGSPSHSIRSHPSHSPSQSFSQPLSHSRSQSTSIPWSTSIGTTAADTTTAAAFEAEVSWGSAAHPAPAAESSSGPKDEWEAATAARERRDQILPPSLMSIWVREFESVLDEVWPPPAESASKDAADSSWRAASDLFIDVATKADDMIPSIPLTRPTPFVETEMFRRSAAAIKLTRHSAVAQKSPFATLQASRGSTAWEESISRFEAPSGQDGWGILSTQLEGEKKPKEEAPAEVKKGGLLSFFSRKESTVPPPASMPLVSASTDGPAAGTTSSSEPRASISSIGALDGISSTGAPTLGSQTGPSTIPVAPLVPTTSNDVTASFEDPTNTEDSTTAAPSAVSRFLGRFSRPNPSRDIGHQPMALSESDMSFLGDLVPSAGGIDDDDDGGFSLDGDLLGGGSSLLKGPTEVKVAPLLPPPPLAPPPRSSSRASTPVPGAEFNFLSSPPPPSGPSVLPGLGSTQAPQAPPKDDDDFWDAFSSPPPPSNPSGSTSAINSTPFPLSPPPKPSGAASSWTNPRGISSNSNSIRLPPPSTFIPSPLSSPFPAPPSRKGSGIIARMATSSTQTLPSSFTSGPAPLLPPPGSIKPKPRINPILANTTITAPDTPSPAHSDVSSEDDVALGVLAMRVRSISGSRPPSSLAMVSSMSNPMSDSIPTPTPETATFSFDDASASGETFLLGGGSDKAPGAANHTASIPTASFDSGFGDGDGDFGDFEDAPPSAGGMGHARAKSRSIPLPSEIMRQRAESNASGSSLSISGLPSPPPGPGRSSTLGGGGPRTPSFGTGSTAPALRQPTASIPGPGRSSTLGAGPGSAGSGLNFDFLTRVSSPSGSTASTTSSPLNTDSGSFGSTRANGAAFPPPPRPPSRSYTLTPPVASNSTSNSPLPQVPLFPPPPGGPGAIRSPRPSSAMTPPLPASHARLSSSSSMMSTLSPQNTGASVSSLSSLGSANGVANGASLTSGFTAATTNVKPAPGKSGLSAQDLSFFENLQ
ncbi:hypothetical protein DL93DRAFT_1484578 [Clavulina sp. PMI_390]|nr:hypothetical protein DL93DRAFT_1484578 [Clavulina sp. PMI_390]